MSQRHIRPAKFVNHVVQHGHRARGGRREEPLRGEKVVRPEPRVVVDTVDRVLRVGVKVVQDLSAGVRGDVVSPDGVPRVAQRFPGGSTAQPAEQRRERGAVTRGGGRRRRPVRVFT